MSHPLEEVIRGADRFVLIGDSSKKYFPATSFHSYTKVGKPFYCLDLGGLTESRGPSKGVRVYTSAAELPADHADLAVLWVPPSSVVQAVDVAHEAGCRRVWFSFHTASAEGVARAKQLRMEIVEIGRCPVYYMDDRAGGCSMHTAIVKLTGTYQRPPQKTLDETQRVLL